MVAGLTSITERIRHCISKPANAKTTQDLATFYRTLIERLNNDFNPSENYAFSTLLAGSLITFSKSMGQVQEPAKTELRDLSSSLQLHIDSLCGVMEKILKREMKLDQPDTRRELELIVEIMISYSGLVRNRPNLEQSKSWTAITPLITCALCSNTYIN